jgi:ABC-2 type transport system ATP-binding protein
MRHLHRSIVRAEVTSSPPALTGIPGVHDVVVDGHQVSCSVSPEGLSDVLTALNSAGLVSLTSTPPSLEELFLDAYRTSPTGVLGASSSS